MATLTAIRELTVRGRSVGLDKLRSDLAAVKAEHLGLAQAAGRAGSATDAASRQQDAAQTRWAKQQSRVDAVAKAYLRFEQDLQRAVRAIDNGTISADAAAREIERMQRALEAAGAVNLPALDQSGLHASLGVMVDDVRGAARESAAAFEAEFARLDDIARQRAEASGRAFREAFERSVGIGAPSAVSGGATYSALEEQARRQEEIEQARLAQAAAGAQQGINDSFGIGRAAPSARASAEVFEQAAGAEEEMAAKAAALRAQIDPLTAATNRLNAELDEYRAMAAAGAISSAEFEAAAGLAQRRFGMTAKAIEASGKVAGFTGFQLQNLGFQLNDAATMALSGASAFQILATQGGQVWQVLAMAEGGAAAGLKSLGATLLGFVTPMGVAIALIMALVVAVAAATVSFRSAQREARSTADGFGRFAQMSGEQLLSLADSAAQANGLTRGVARELANAYANTGKIGGEALSGLIGITKDYAATTGQGLDAARDDLARLFSDPAKGAQELTDKLGAFDDRTLRLISTLSAAGERTRAQQVMLDALEDSLVKSSERVTGLARAWDLLKNAISGVYDALGRFGSSFVDSFTGAKTAEQELREIQEAQAQRRGILEGPSGSSYGPDSYLRRDYENADRRERELREQMDRERRMRAQADANRRGTEAGETARSLLPESGRLDDLRARQKQLTDALNDPDVAKGAADIDQWRAALDRVNAAIDSYLGPAEKARRLRELDLRAIEARTPAQRAEIEAERARVEAAGDVERSLYAEAEAKAAAARVYAESNRAIQEAELERAVSSDERRASAAFELQSIGRTAQETDRLRFVMEQTNQLRREAYQLTGDRHAFDDRIAAIEEEADALAKLAQAQRQASLAQKLADDRRRSFMSEGEASIDRQLTDAGLLLNGQPTEAGRELVDYKGARVAAAEAYADVMRINDALKEVKETGRGAWDAIGEGLSSGQGLGKSLAAGGRKLLSDLGKKSWDNLYDNAWSMAGEAFPELKSLGLGGKPDGSAARPFHVVMGAGGGISDVIAKGLGAGGDVTRAPLGPIANDNAANARVAQAFGVFNPNAAAQAIKDIESSGGNYGALGPLTRTGDRAYGAYQIMGANIGPWSERYLGRRLTPQAFLADREAQDSIFQGEFGRLSAKYGPEGASRAWFAGEGGMWKPGATDVVGTSVGGYGSRFGQLYGQYAGAGSAAFGPQFAPVPAAPQLTAATESLSTFTQNAQQATAGLGGLGQTATGLGGVFQTLLGGLGGAPSAGGTGVGLGAFGSILGIGLKLFGFDDGGYTGAAGRGQVAGVVHGQEFVVNAAATSQHRGLLEAINDGRLPGFAEGGYVGNDNYPAAGNDNGWSRVRAIPAPPPPPQGFGGGELTIRVETNDKAFSAKIAKTSLPIARRESAHSGAQAVDVTRKNYGAIRAREQRHGHTN
ncbi:phage tail length tape measure family protein [Hansschlegelia sp.]|uniref:phage tail length tape measure family protein n=1 Tax=Hansschlegelia sp. TaxID=2041892 RepID=UPI002C4A53EF|nr:phage tail length tape measure family protein [Hansschlegelia sp.]HVI27626.1 phage tail length tape measure family protein [Hansschlegelia sp.]